jgi:hypothetical protein
LLKLTSAWTYYTETSFRSVLRKLEKGYEAVNIENAHLRRDNEILEGKVCTLQPTGKKKVLWHLKDTFPKPDEIERARVLAEKESSAKAADEFAESLQRDVELV